MKPFKTIQSQIMPIPLKDIDTDMIIPAQYLTAIDKEGFGEHLFARFREDPNFKYMNQFPAAKILVARENFGCGSSREHAVWALQSWGIDVVIAPSFANIHQNNALKNGLLEIALEKEIVGKMLKECVENEEYKITVDLENQSVELPDGEMHFFEIDPYRKTCLLNGMGDLDYLLSKKEAIRTFDEQRGERLYFSVDKK